MDWLDRACGTGVLMRGRCKTTRWKCLLPCFFSLQLFCAFLPPTRCLFFTLALSLKPDRLDLQSLSSLLTPQLAPFPWPTTRRVLHQVATACARAKHPTKKLINILTENIRFFCIQRPERFWHVNAENESKNNVKKLYLHFSNNYETANRRKFY